MPGANKATITLVDPPVVVASTTTQVEFHLEFRNNINCQQMQLICREGRERAVLQNVDEAHNTITVEVTPERIGVLKISIESEEGQCLSAHAFMVAAPSVVVEDLNQVFSQSVEDTVSAVRSGAATHIPLQLAELEENPLLARKTAWQMHFHPMVMDFGGLLEHLGECEDRLVVHPVNPTHEHYTNRILYLLRFFVKNNARKAGSFLLQYAAASGEVITLNGMPLNSVDLDLEALLNSI